MPPQNSFIIPNNKYPYKGYRKKEEMVMNWHYFLFIYYIVTNHKNLGVCILWGGDKLNNTIHYFMI